MKLTRTLILITWLLVAPLILPSAVSASSSECTTACISWASAQEENINNWIKQLDLGKDVNVWVQAREKLLQAGSTAVPFLINALNNKRIVGEVVSLLGQIKDPRAVEPLISVLNSNDRKVPYARILDALGALGKQEPRAFEAVIAALKHPDSSYRGAAITSLQINSEVRAFDNLVAALADTNPEVQELAARALVQLDESRGLEVLTAALGQQNTRLAVEKVLKETDARGKPTMTISGVAITLLDIERGDQFSRPFIDTYKAKKGHEFVLLRIRFRNAEQVDVEQKFFRILLIDTDGNELPAPFISLAGGGGPAGAITTSTFPFIAGKGTRLKTLIAEEVKVDKKTLSIIGVIQRDRIEF